MSDVLSDIETSAGGLPPDEAALLMSLRAGDAAAFEQLVREYGGRMLAVTRRFLASEEDAQDAVQEAFLSAFKALDRFEGQSRLGTWLHRIAVNAALMKLRTRKSRPQEQSADALLPQFKDDGHAVHPTSGWRDEGLSALERKETRDVVRRSIEELPENYRTVLLLRDIEQKDTEETAELLGMTPNAVKTRLHRARLALRELLDPHFRGGLL
jgi:RNA polymerase sigma-70 factor (ECF subfamily)